MLYFISIALHGLSSDLCLVTLYILTLKKIHRENQRLLELKTEIEAKKTQQPSVKKADIETTVVSKVIGKTNHTCAAH